MVLTSDFKEELDTRTFTMRGLSLDPSTVRRHVYDLEGVGLVEVIGGRPLRTRARAFTSLAALSASAWFATSRRLLGAGTMVLISPI